MTQTPPELPDRRPAAWAVEAIPQSDYADIERALASSASPVGIDAKHTHVLILHALERIERRLARATASPDPDEQREAPTELDQAQLRARIVGMLDRVPAYAALDLPSRDRLVDALTRLTEVALGAATDAQNFPAFVSELIQGTFESIVDASIRQMQAYTELLEGVSGSLERFASEVEGEAARAARRSLLAEMALMGLTRLQFHRGHVRAKGVFASDDEDEDEDEDDRKGP